MSVRDTVNNWFGQRLACGALARDTEAYNQVAAALPELIAQLDPTDAPAPIDATDAAAEPPADKTSAKGAKASDATLTPAAPANPLPTA
jgi:hypothetical protein